MVVKTLQVFYGADCLPYKDIQRTVHYPIVEPAFQGASQVNQIKFYVDQIGSLDTTWIAVAKLPNGKVGMKALQVTEDTNGTYALLSLNSWFTQAKGDLYISLKGYDGGAEIVYDSETETYKISGNPVIQSTGSIKLTIKYATLVDESDEEGITTQEILALISDKVGKQSKIYIRRVADKSDLTEDEEYSLVDGSIILDLATSDFYSVTKEGDTITYTKIDIAHNCLKYIDITGTTTIGDLGVGLHFVIYSGTYYMVKITIGATSSDYVYRITTLGSLQAWKGTTTSSTIIANIIQNNSLRSDLLDQATDQTIDGRKTFTYPYGVLVGETSKTAYRNGSITLISAGGVETDYTIPSGGGTFAMQSYVQQQIEIATFSVYKPQGSATVSELNSLTKTQAMNGYVYNMSNGGSLTNYNGSTEVVTAGDNVVFIWNDGNWYWDDVVGIVDLSGYVQKIQTIAGIALSGNISAQDLTNALVFATDSDIESIMED